ncbi:hypothetical protein M3J07_013887 [Ascochyta lentis]
MQNEQQQTRTSQLDERMMDVEESMTGVQDRINDVKRGMAGVEKLATRVEDSVQNVRNRVRVVEERVESNDERITDAGKRITSTEDDIADAKERFIFIEDRMVDAENAITGARDLTARVSALERQLHKVKASLQDPAASSPAVSRVPQRIPDPAASSPAVSRVPQRIPDPAASSPAVSRVPQRIPDPAASSPAVSRVPQRIPDPAASSPAVSRVPQRIPVPAASSPAVSPVPQRIPVPAMSSLSADAPLMSGGASLEAPNPTNSPLVAQDLERSRSATPVGRRDQYLASLSTPRPVPTPVFSVPILNHTVPPRRDARFPAHVFKRRDANKGRRRDSMPTSMRVAKCNNQVKVKRATRYPLIKACLMTSLFTGTFVVAGVAAGASYWVWENVYHYESKYA